ncbi:hypothetical protein A3D77_01110 [Candidatus Gottesmanbacteria bacterium RIFCSPHIGHO2_02_FULL_39_11]|uniref:Ribbon-helix-helix protein CopG domain-containing protein n=1 Tax=Candidatus Gottesmanbacteria bacterium RIFCSPHIGHO2_02_FULL_39_11 TaxID=1798382 RepID=A0A1F5ZYL2_9BACT|nr:MAG: hypothetical protein A3D77_01110 [Candidatus Gottesmanbacteria bacterium RIFCSPHIGHO2_02_FULL_39_11]
MTRTQIYLPGDQLIQLQFLAKKKNTKMSKLIRAFIEHGIENERKKAKKNTFLTDLAGSVTKGPKDVSKNLDKYLYGS